MSTLPRQPTTIPWLPHWQPHTPTTGRQPHESTSSSNTKSYTAGSMRTPRAEPNNVSPSARKTGGVSLVISQASIRDLKPKPFTSTTSIASTSNLSQVALPNSDLYHSHRYLQSSSSSSSKTKGVNKAIPYSPRPRGKSTNLPATPQNRSTAKANTTRPVPDTNPRPWMA